MMTREDGESNGDTGDREALHGPECH
jgi:hypothetical protein